MNSESNSSATTKAEPKASQQPPNIVICSDGTWNKGGALNPTNVWRTYLLVKSENQIKLHDNGVGSEGVRVMQILGGAFGYGISNNLTDLIEFLINSWQPGSKIFLFGFSRGAFTIRVFADIICTYGIPDRSELSTPELVRKASASLLKRYKAENKMRDRAKKPKKNRTSEESAAQIKKESNVAEVQAEFNCRCAPIEFMGCWDTVEALGIPIEALKKIAIQYFPLRFRNTVPSSKIKLVCHALSLDDERNAFHPLCFTDNDAEGQTIHQTWFPGNHCHIGGGYARDQIAMVPLKWMLEHAQNAGLKIDKMKYEELVSTGYSHGQLPSARAGMNFFYGYNPRRISKFQPKGPWHIHASTFQRLGKQTQPYFPTSIVFGDSNLDPNSPEIVVDGGGVEMELQGDVRNPKMIPVSFDRSQLESYETKMKEVNDRNIWTGRMLYVACLLFVITAALFGFLNRNPNPETELSLAPGSPWVYFQFFYGVEQAGLLAAKAFMPSFLFETFLQGFLNRPGSLFAWLVGALALLHVCKRNRRVVEEEAMVAWRSTGFEAFGNLPAANQPNNYWFIDTLMRRLASVVPKIRIVTDAIYDALFKFGLFVFRSWLGLVVPAIFGVIAFITATFGFGYFWEYGHRVRVAEKSLISLEEGDEFKPEIEFEPNNVCFSTGVMVRKGQKYLVTVTETTPFRDKNINASPDGFDNKSEGDGIMFWPRISREHKMFTVLGSIEPGDGELIEIGSNGRFVADSDGVLVLFVNDVIGFYANNRGSAKVKVTRLDDQDVINGSN